jgi:hypothetical protein
VDSVEAARHDATSLYKFIDTVVQPCSSKSHFSYTKSSEEFFTYIIELGQATKNHVSDLVERLNAHLLASNPADFHRQAREIATLRFSWYRLHKFIKPALDAHTLESPFGLVDFLTQRLRQVKGFDKVCFAVVHTSDLNYFQLQSSFVRQLGEQMSSIISGAPSFPPNLAVVGIPYSQAGSVFLNTALAHEMGHFSFQLRDVKKDLLPLFYSILLRHNTSQFNSGDIARCTDLVVDWLEEIYCDLFALCLSGPAFSFAFIDLLALSRNAPSRTCTASHPADALRLRQQARLLQEPSIGWWSVIQSSSNHYVKLLADSLAITDAEFVVQNAVAGGVEAVALQCFLQMIAEPQNAIIETFKDLEVGVAEYAKLKTYIQSFLSHGVVPSRLVVDGVPTTPSGLTVLNATYFFYLDSLDELLARISTTKKDCLECRSNWAERVEMWTAKALEDVTTNGYTFAAPH